MSEESPTDPLDAPAPPDSIPSDPPIQDPEPPAETQPPLPADGPAPYRWSQPDAPAQDPPPPASVSADAPTPEPPASAQAAPPAYAAPYAWSQPGAPAQDPPPYAAPPAYGPPSYSRAQPGPQPWAQAGPHAQAPPPPAAPPGYGPPPYSGAQPGPQPWAQAGPHAQAPPPPAAPPGYGPPPYGGAQPGPPPWGQPGWSPYPPPAPQWTTSPRRRVWPIVLAGVCGFGGGVIVSIVVAVAGFAIVDDFMMPEQESYEAGTAAAEAETGECFVHDDVDVSTDDPINCDQSHGFEIFARRPAIDQPEARYPMREDLEFLADSICIAEFEPYVGRAYLDSSLEYVTLIPTREAWNEGEHDVVCGLVSLDTSTLQGTSKDSGR